MKLKGAAKKVTKSSWTAVGLVLEANAWYKQKMDDYVEMLPALTTHLPQVKMQCDELAKCTKLTLENLKKMESMYESLPTFLVALPLHAGDLMESLLHKSIYMGNLAVSEGACAEPGVVQLVGSILAAAVVHFPLDKELGEMRSLVGEIIEESTVKANSKKLVEAVQNWLVTLTDEEASIETKRDRLHGVPAAKGDVVFTKIPDDHREVIQKGMDAVLDETCVALQSASNLTDGYMDALLNGGEMLSEMCDPSAEKCMALCRSMAVLKVMKTSGPMSKEMQRSFTDAQVAKLLGSKLEHLQAYQREIGYFEVFKDEAEQAGYPKNCEEVMPMLIEATMSEYVGAFTALVSKLRAGTESGLQDKMSALRLVAGGTTNGKLWYEIGQEAASGLDDLSKMAMLDGGLFSMNPDNVHAKTAELQKAGMSREEVVLATPTMQ